jgi:hypothetical protein
MGRSLEKSSGQASAESSEASSPQAGCESLAAEPTEASPRGREEALVPKSSGVLPGWQTLLSGSPREVLSRLVQDDPLGLRGRIAERLRADALLLDGDRAHLRALARISRCSGSYRGRPELSEWVDGAVRESVEELVRERHEHARRLPRARDDRERERRTEPASAPETRDGDAFEALAGPLGLEPSSMRVACSAFNVLPFADRSAFFDLVLEARDLDGCARAAGVSASEIARRGRRALDAILGPALASGSDSRSCPDAPRQPGRAVVERAIERPADKDGEKGRKS